MSFPFFNNSFNSAYAFEKWFEKKLVNLSTSRFKLFRLLFKNLLNSVVNINSKININIVVIGILTFFIILAVIIAKINFEYLGFSLLLILASFIISRIYEEIYRFKLSVEIPTQLYNELGVIEKQFPDIKPYIDDLSTIKERKYNRGDYSSSISYSAYHDIMKYYNTLITTKDNSARELELKKENEYSDIKSKLNKFPSLKNICSSIDEICNNSSIYRKINNEYWFLNTKNCTTKQLQKIDDMMKEQVDLKNYIDSIKIKGVIKASKYNMIVDRYNDKKLQIARDKLFKK